VGDFERRCKRSAATSIRTTGTGYGLRPRTHPGRHSWSTITCYSTCEYKQLRIQLRAHLHNKSEGWGGDVSDSFPPQSDELLYLASF